MANDVKWIKLKVGMFDGMSFKKIKRAKIGGESFRDKLTAVWFELMDFAGKCNHNGAFVDSREIPFKELSDIAMMIDREEAELQLCMSFFINEGMVSIVDDVYMLSTWSAYQNTEGLDKIREQNRIRQAKYKQKQKLLKSGNVTDNVTVTEGNGTDIDIEEDTEEETKEDIIKNNISTSASPSPSKSKKPVKHKHGEFKNVLLTDEELQKLTAEYGDILTLEAITFLDEYIEEKGYKSKSHNLAIRRWVIEAVQDKKKKPAAVNQPKQQNSTNDFMSQLQRMYNEEC